MFLHNSAQAVVLFLAEECQRKEPAAPYRPILPSGSNQDTRIHRNDVTSTSRPTGRGKSSQERGKSPTDLTEVRVINNSNREDFRELHRLSVRVSDGRVETRGDGDRTEKGFSQ